MAEIDPNYVMRLERIKTAALHILPYIEHAQSCPSTLGFSNPEGDFCNCDVARFKRALEEALDAK